jgi:hypothetical protein
VLDEGGDLHLEVAGQSLQHNADLLFSQKMPARRPPDVLCRRFLRPG